MRQAGSATGEASWLVFSAGNFATEGRTLGPGGLCGPLRVIQAGCSRSRPVHPQAIICLICRTWATVSRCWKQAQKTRPSGGEGLARRLDACSQSRWLCSRMPSRQVAALRGALVKPPREGSAKNSRRVEVSSKDRLSVFFRADGGIHSTPVVNAVAAEGQYLLVASEDWKTVRQITRRYLSLGGIRVRSPSSDHEQPELQSTRMAAIAGAAPDSRPGGRLFNEASISVKGSRCAYSTCGWRRAGSGATRDQEFAPQDSRTTRRDLTMTCREALYPRSCCSIRSITACAISS